MAVINKEYSLKISTEQAQKNVELLNENLKIQEDLLFDIEKEIRDYEKQLKKTSKTDLAARKAINDKIAQTKERLNDERFGLKELNKERKKANEELDESIENSAEYGGVLGMVDQKTGGLVSSIGGMTTSLKSATKGLSLLRIGIIGTGIGALLIAITSLTAAFTSSEEGQNSFNKLLGVMGAITGVFTDRLASLGRGLINLFTSPIETLKNFGKSIKEFVMDKVDKVVESLGFLGSAISKLFKGDFSGALEDAGKGVIGLNEALNPAVILTKALVKGTKELIKELTEEGKAAAAIADQRAKADKLERSLITERATANQKRADLLAKAIDKEKFSTQERIEFLKEAGKIEDEITAKEILAAELRLNAKIAENKLGDSTKEDLDEEANLRAKLITLETDKINKSKEVTSQIIGFNAEAAAAKKTLDDQEIADAKAIQDFKDSLRIKDKENKFADIEQERADRILAIEELKLTKEQEQQMLLDVEAAFKEKKKIIEEEEKVIADEKKAADLERLLGEKELTLEEQKTEALTELDRLKGTEGQKQQIIAKFDKKQKDLDELRKQQTMNDAKQTLNGIAQLAGKGSAVGKAMAIASATISGVQGVQNAYTTAQKSPITIGFPAYPVVQAAIAGAIAVKNLAAIKSVNPSGGGGGNIPAVSGGTGPTPSTPPAFNIVGSSQTNQLADAIGGQSQQPVQAFVVASEVTTAQSLERNTIESATIG